MKRIPEQWRQAGKVHRKHSHYRVLVTYTDGEVFAKVYNGKKKAAKYAVRQL